MVESTISYQGQLHCVATHGPSGSKIETDAPVDNMGKGEKFSPSDLVGAALGSCILTIMGIVAQKHNLDLAGTTCRVQKEMVTTPMRRIGRLAVTVNVPVKLSGDDQRRLENAARNCPVHRSLHPSIESPIVFQWAR
jgi:putative redox protein